MNYAYEKVIAREDIEENREFKRDLQNYKVLNSFYTVMKDFQKTFTSREFESHKANLELKNDLSDLKNLSYYKKRFPNIIKIERVEEYSINQQVEIAQYYADGNPISEKSLDRFFEKGCQITRKTEIKEKAVIGKRYYYSVDLKTTEEVLEKYTNGLKDTIRSIKNYANGLIIYVKRLEDSMGK